MGRRVVGQDEAVHAVSDCVRLSRTGLREHDRPQGVFLFLGPTGVGKTELTKALSEFIFDDPSAILRIDMSECVRHPIASLPPIAPIAPYCTLLPAAMHSVLHATVCYCTASASFLLLLLLIFLGFACYCIGRCVARTGIWSDIQ